MQQWKTSVMEVELNTCGHKVALKKKVIKSENSGINLRCTINNVRKQLSKRRHTVLKNDGVSQIGREL